MRDVRVELKGFVDSLEDGVVYLVVGLDFEVGGEEFGWGD
jgi:hypothetical protein